MLSIATIQKSRMRFRSSAIWLAAGSALLLAACGGSDTQPVFEGSGSALTHAAANSTAFTNSATTTVGSWDITVVDLGLLPSGSASSARAINDNGEVVGLATDSSFNIVRVIWDLKLGSVVRTLPNFDLSSTAEPESINVGGEVSGTERISSTLRTGVYWDAFGSVYGLPAYGGGSTVQITAHQINDSGQIAGSSRDANQIVNPVVWVRNGAPRSLGFLGNGKGGEAFGINNLGHVVGAATNGAVERAFLWRGDKLQDLGAVGGSTASARATALNNKGLIAGTSDAGTIPVSWRYDPSNPSSTPALTRLGVPSGLTLAAPAAANDNGDIVGTASLQNFTGTRAVLWRGGEAIDLGTWPGGANSKAFGINNLGQIVGQGDLNGNGLNHALVWIVTPAGSASPSPSPGPSPSPTPDPGTATNAAPTVSLKATSSTSLKLSASATVSVQGSYSDPDNGPWRYSFDWGDGTSTSGSSSAPGTLAASHAYLAASPKGGYKVVLTVTDGAGASGQSGAVSVKVSGR